MLGGTEDGAAVVGGVVVGSFGVVQVVGPPDGNQVPGGNEVDERRKNNRIQYSKSLSLFAISKLAGKPVQNTNYFPKNYPLCQQHQLL